MKNYLIIPALVVILFIGCKEKKEAKHEPPISALSIIKGQLNELDTSLYSIIKYETTDNITDTAYLRREEVRKFAAPFLSLPEIADKKYYKNYAKFPDVMRRWNISTGVGTFVAYSTGRINWQVGPHLRYQHLSSFVSELSVKEKLYAIGLKVGATLNNNKK